MDGLEKKELTILSEISRISNSPADLGHKLQRIVNVVAHGMEKEGASVFLIDPSGRNVTLAAAVGLNQESIGRLSFPLGTGIAGWVAEQKVPIALLDPYSDPRFSYVPDSGIGRFRSLAAAPILDEDQCLGVIFVLSSEPWSPSSSDITLLSTTANQISGVIRSARLLDSIQERLSELATLYEIGMAITSTLDLDQILGIIAKNTSQILHARGCAIRLVNLLDGHSSVRTAYQAGEENMKQLDGLIGQSVAEKIAAERRAVVLEDIARSDFARTDPAIEPCPLMGVPLMYHDKAIGVIILYGTDDGRPFTEEDLQFLTTISGTAAVAIMNAVMYDRMEALAEESRSRASELAILYDIATAMGTTLNLDRLLRIILTAATMGGAGLGFNRAILLLVNERSNTLQGMMGVGPSSWEEAGRVWSEVAGRHKSLLEWIQSGEIFRHHDTEFNSLARSIRVPLSPEEGVLALTALERRAFNIKDAASDRIVPRELRELLRVNSFATAPLVVKDKAIGVILVDNMFNQRPITDGDIRFLSMFANQAALAVDNAIIHTNLEAMNRDMRSMQEQLVQSEKMAALGAMMAEITHEIRNPLVSIGGFARRLASKVAGEAEKKYIDIILREVSRLEGIIHDNLAFIREMTPELKEDDLNGVVEDVIELYEDELLQRGIEVKKELADSLPAASFDRQQIKQAVINLITNAMEAMPDGGVITVASSYRSEPCEVVVEIKDTGPGIPADAMHNIFNPYYTTKVRGTGLGLPITHRIVKAHRGRIEVRNQDSGGAVFAVFLPCPSKDKTV